MLFVQCYYWIICWNIIDYIIDYFIHDTAAVNWVTLSLLPATEGSSCTSLEDRSRFLGQTFSLLSWQVASLTTAAAEFMWLQVESFLKIQKNTGNHVLVLIEKCAWTDIMVGRRQWDILETFWVLYSLQSLSLILANASVGLLFVCCIFHVARCCIYGWPVSFVCVCMCVFACVHVCVIEFALRGLCQFTWRGSSSDGFEGEERSW